MAAFVLIVGVFNFVLGYLLALALADPPLLGLLSGDFWRHVWQGIKAGFKRQNPSMASDDDDAMPDERSPAASLPAIAPVSELPEVWQNLLREAGLGGAFLASGIAHVLRLEGAVYRDQLLTAEARARQALATQDALAMEQLAADLRFINVDWARKQRQGAELIEEREGRLGPAEPQALQLAQLLRDQAAHIADVDRELQGLDFRTERTMGCRRLLAEVEQLVRLAHRLRDEITVCLAEILRCEGELGSVNRQLHYDVITGMLCRLGLEALFVQEPKSARPSAAMHISLDRFVKVNQRLGTRAGDHALKAIGALIAELAGVGSETTVIARQAGSEFLVLAQERTVEDLSATAELIRQSFEATGFSYQGTDFSLTLTISVAAVAADDALPDVLARLEAVRGAAVKAGLNRCARWENGAATLTLPPAIAVPARVIAIETTAA